MNQTSFNQLTKISKTFKKLKKTSFDELKFYLITIYHKINSKLIKQKRSDFVTGRLGGLICLDHVWIESLDSWENLNTFKKLILKIEISWFSLDINVQTQKSQSRSKFIMIYKKSWLFLDLDWEVAWIFINLNQDYYFWSILLIDICGRSHPSTDVYSKISQKMSRNLDKSQ